jgi:hypothetical protein
MDETEYRAAEIRIKRIDNWIKGLGAFFIGASVIVSGLNNAEAFRRQQALFEATEQKEWARRLFDAQFAVYDGIATAAFKLKAVQNRKEAVANLASVKEWEAKASLLANAEVLVELRSVCEAAERFIADGEQNPRPDQRIHVPPDLIRNCARLIRECRAAALHSGSVKLPPREAAEHAVSTAYGELLNTAGTRDERNNDTPNPQVSNNRE